MPKYHFVGKEVKPGKLSENARVTVEYLNNGFDNAIYRFGNEKRFSFKACGGSVIFVDHTASGLNKLHLGELVVNNPHIESNKEHGISGPRLDLSRVDRSYADLRLKYLKRIQTPRSRWKYVLEYSSYGRYTIPWRLRELAASSSTLEEMIDEHRENRDFLASLPNRDFVFEQTTGLEASEATLVRKMTEASSGLHVSSSGKAGPKIIESQDIFGNVEELHSTTKKTIEFIHNHPNFDMEYAQNYWNRVYSYAERVKDFDFVKYNPDFITHLVRHFSGSQTPGSVFLDSSFSNAVEVIDLAFDLVKRKYDGDKLVLVHECPKPIGLNAVIALKDLPPTAQLSKDNRDGEHEVNVVSGIKRKLTNKITIIAEPLGEKNFDTEEKHGFSSIYPGEFCPDHKDLDFWETHAFIVD
jgi:hypothetical protein